MRCRAAFIVCALLVLAPALSTAQAPVGLTGPRPGDAGITRTTVKDDAKVVVTRVSFAPGAAEAPHTHAFDLLVVAVTSGPVNLVIGDKTITSLKAGEVQNIPHDVTHHLGNAGKEPLEVIAIGVK